jgi:hypothetical protein
MGVPVDALLPVDEQELLRKAGRYHSQLQHIEYEVGWTILHRIMQYWLPGSQLEVDT